MLAAQNGFPVPQVPSAAGAIVRGLCAFITFQRFVTNQNSQSQKRTVLPAISTKDSEKQRSFPRIACKVSPNPVVLQLHVGHRRMDGSTLVKRESSLVRLQSAIGVFEVRSVSITEGSR
jgi:hypothetical protein